jgi:hypothetical protein
VAKQTVVQLLDDIDGGQADETVTFSLDGVDYQIDLSTSNADKLRKGLSEYVGHATKVGGRRKRGAVAGAAGRDKAQNQAIREWARETGEPISERGRIPEALVLKFQAVHGG